MPIRPIIIISQFERCMLRAWPNISQLYLSNNNIQTFDGLFYNRPWCCPETEATALWIKHNQLDCTFVDTWVPNISNDRFAKYCIHAVNRLFHVEAIHACECASPPDMKGVSLLSLGKGHWWHHDFLRYWSFVWRGIITMTSQWTWWRLKSPASRLFTQLFIQA